MAPEVRSQAFEPLFTTKPAEQGTGLGLSTAYVAITESDGDITVPAHWFEASGLQGELGNRLDELLSAHSGPTPVYLHVLEDSGRRTVLRSRKYRVRACDEVTNALTTVLGPGRARWAPRL